MTDSKTAAEELEQQIKNADIREQYLKFLSGQVSYTQGKTTQTRTRKPEQWTKVVETPSVDITDQNVWVWSDLHFGHSNIIRFSDRPYPDTPTMDAHLIENFNDYVGVNDTSIWVGDISFYNDRKSQEIVRRCNGYKILIVGNHDFDHGKLKNLAFDEVHITYTLDIDGVSLVFSHYPFPVTFPDINVHGHEHISKERTEFSHSVQHINVCCEYHNYKPLNLTEIIRWAKIRITSYDPKRSTHPSN